VRPQGERHEFVSNAAGSACQRDYVIEKRYDGTSQMPFSTVKIDWTYDILGRLVAEMRDLDDDGQRDPGDYTDFFAFDLAGNRVLKVRGWDVNGDGVLEPARSTSQPPPPSTPATSSSRSS
jgi:hypothetical protein